MPRDHLPETHTMTPASLSPRSRRHRRVALVLGAAALLAGLGAAAPYLVRAAQPPVAAAPTAASPDDAPRFADVRLASGVRLRYAERGRAAGMPVILLHGFTDSWFSYSRVLPALAATHHVYALDQRGHGGSDRPTGGYSAASMAEDVIAFMDARGIARAAVVGHSMGSIVAQHVAARAPDRVERLVLVGSGRDARNDVIADLRRAVAAMGDTIGDGFVREFQLEMVQRAVPPAFLEGVVAESRRVPVHVWNAVLGGLVGDAPAPVERVRAPTLLVWGDRDAVFTRADQDALLGAIPGASLAVYAGTGHSPHWEEPQRFARDVAAFLAAPLSGADSVKLYDDLGDHTHAITTSRPLAQRYFDQGLRLTYGFNHAEAIRAFRAAQRLDPTCAMCYWGEALAFGPNINAAMDSASGVAAYRAARAAQERAAAASAEERTLIAAMAARYGADPAAARKARDSAYARAMHDAARRFPASDDAAVLHAEAEMLLSPWDYWAPGKRAKPNARRALDDLERVLARNPDHAGACHYYIHAVEAAHPARALPCAERLPTLMPGAGHVVHMPAHIYIRLGRYADAVDRNVHALHADDQHVADLAPDGVYRLMYNPHNDHFLWFAATMAGREAQALAAARQTARKASPDLMRQPGLVALQHYLVTPLFALVRFGRWDAVLAEPAPPADLPYPTAIRHYARALALSAKGRAAEAEGELAALRRARATPGVDALLIWDLNSAGAVLDVAIASVEGELAARKGDAARATERLRRGVALEDAMTYDEPPTWHLPVRHALGAVLLEAGRASEAERVYREDLERHPENGWALVGLAESLRKQGRRREADAASARMKAAWATADVQLHASRF